MEYVELCEAIKELAEELDKMGYALCVIKKPRQYELLNEKTALECYGTLYGRNNVKERREALGWTRNKLAAQMGIAGNLVARMEDPQKRHTEHSMKPFAEFFGCTIEDLLDDMATD